MLKDLQLLNIYGAMARHAALSQQVTSANIANADTPGYKASELESFQDFISRAAQAGAAAGLDPEFRVLSSTVAASPNGNNVSLEREIFNSAEAMGQHNLALTVYSKSLEMLRTALGRQR